MKLLTLARDLSRRKAREKHSLFVAEGVRSVEELLRSDLTVRGALVAPQLADAPRGAALRRQLEESRIEVLEVSEKDFRSAAETESPQGILAIAEIPQRSLDTLQLPAVCRLLLLDGVQDPGNVGTILRTAAALGATATVALPGTVDLWNSKVIRSSMGAQFHHPVLHAGVGDALDFLSRKSLELWATDSAGTPFERDTAPARLAIALGNEGAGISSSVREKAGRIVSLPVSGSVESLNVAVAAGILLYELRQSNGNP
ncbi:MAG TPA: RNA methyltransferase [Gemmatimonadaceae bacterium]|nr:RNA methyltransferase [Gemmatimonadaceae bacterium]